MSPQTVSGAPSTGVRGRKARGQGSSHHHGVLVLTWVLGRAVRVPVCSKKSCDFEANCLISFLFMVSPPSYEMGLDLPWCTGVLGWESLGVCLADRGRVGACGEGPTCAYVNNKHLLNQTAQRMKV